MSWGENQAPTDSHKNLSSFHRKVSELQVIVYNLKLCSYLAGQSCIPDFIHMKMLYMEAPLLPEWTPPYVRLAEVLIAGRLIEKPVHLSLHSVCLCPYGCRSLKEKFLVRIPTFFSVPPIL